MGAALVGGKSTTEGARAPKHSTVTRTLDDSRKRGGVCVEERKERKKDRNIHSNTMKWVDAQAEDDE